MPAVPAAPVALRVFILDDAAPLRMLLRRILCDLGHEVVGQGTEIGASLPVLALLRPDLVVMDGRLAPGADEKGIASLRSAVPHATLCVVAALGETALLQAARASGVRYAIPRPYLRSRLRAVLTDIAAERETGRA